MLACLKTHNNQNEVLDETHGISRISKQDIVPDLICIHEMLQSVSHRYTLQVETSKSIGKETSMNNKVQNGKGCSTYKSILNFSDELQYLVYT